MFGVITFEISLFEDPPTKFERMSMKSRSWLKMSILEALYEFMTLAQQGMRGFICKVRLP